MEEKHLWKMALIVVFACTTKGIRVSFDKSSLFQNQALVLINSIRSQHGVPVLELDSELVNSASKWGMLLHRKALKDGNKLHAWFAHPKTEGEAVYANGTAKEPTHVTSQDAIMSWYCEILNYDFCINFFQMNSAQFTQLVWKDTKRVGVVKVVNDDTGSVAIVARFTPTGNLQYRKSFSENVFLPKTFELAKSCPNSKDDVLENKIKCEKKVNGRGFEASVPSSTTSTSTTQKPTSTTLNPTTTSQTPTTTTQRPTSTTHKLLPKPPPVEVKRIAIIKDED